MFSIFFIHCIVICMVNGVIHGKFDGLYSMIKVKLFEDLLFVKSQVNVIGKKWPSEILCVKLTKDLKLAVYESGRYWALVFTVSTEIESTNQTVPKTSIIQRLDEKLTKIFRTGIIPTNSFFIEIIQSSKK